MESLQAAFQCLVCMGALEDAHLCPSCSKFFCMTCIVRWIERHSKCPHCRGPLTRAKLVKCGWVSDVTASLASLEATHADPSPTVPPRPNNPEPQAGSRSSKQKCPTHGAPKDVFCMTCKETICHKCGCFSILHKGHDLQPISDVLEDTKRKIGEKIEQVKARNDELELLINDYEQNAEDLKQVKEHLLVKIQNFVTERMKSLDRQYRVKLAQIDNSRTKLRCEIEKNNLAVGQLSQEFNSLSSTDFLRKRSEIESTIDQLVALPMSSFVSTPVAADFPDELNPKFISARFTVESFEDEVSTNVPLYSSAIHQHGMTWQLKIYPNGNEMARGSHFSVFLQLTNATPAHCSAEYTYQFGVLDRNNKVVFEREFTSEFDVGECWGYNRFLPLGRLRAYLVSDDLKLQFSVRPTSYAIHVRDLENYIAFISPGASENLQQFPLNETVGVNSNYAGMLSSSSSDYSFDINMDNEISDDSDHAIAIVGGSGDGPRPASAPAAIEEPSTLEIINTIPWQAYEPDTEEILAEIDYRMAEP